MFSEKSEWSTMLFLIYSWLDSHFLCLSNAFLSLGPLTFFFNILKGSVILSAFSVHMHVWQYMFEPSPFVFTAQTLQAR